MASYKTFIDNFWGSSWFCSLYSFFRVGTRENWTGRLTMLYDPSEETLEAIWAWDSETGQKYLLDLKTGQVITPTPTLGDL